MSTEELAKLYDEYIEKSEESGDGMFSFFRGWLGMRAESADRDKAFLQAVGEHTLEIADAGDAEAAYETALFILERAAEADKDPAGRCIGAATNFVNNLTPLIDGAQKAKLLEIFNRMPKAFMLDGQIKLKKSLSE